jgi:hypothetical protein
LNFCIEQIIIGRQTAKGEEEEEVKTWLTGGKKWKKIALELFVVSLCGESGSKVLAYNTISSSASLVEESSLFIKDFGRKLA